MADLQMLKSIYDDSPTAQAQFPTFEAYAASKGLGQQTTQPAQEPGFFSKAGTTLARGVIGAGEMGVRGVHGMSQALEDTIGYDTSIDSAKALADRIKTYRDTEFPQAKGLPSFWGEGVESATTSLTPVAAGAAVGAGLGSVVPVVGTAAGAGLGALVSLFGSALPIGGAEYSTAKDEAAAAGLSEADAISLARKRGASEVGTETLSNVLTAGAGKILGKVAAPALKEGVNAILKPTAASVLKQFGITLGAETASELTNSFIQAESNRAAGLSEKSGWEAMREQAPSILVASAIFGGLGPGLGLANNAKIKSLLSNPEADPGQRMAAVDQVAGVIASTDPTAAVVWKQTAAETVQAGQAIPLDQDVMGLFGPQLKRQQDADAARESVAPLYDEAAGAASDAKQQALSDLDGIIADLAGQPKPAPATPAPFQEVGASDPGWDGPKRLDLSDRNVLGRVPNAQWWNQQHGIYNDPAEDFTNPATEQALAALQQQERQRFDRGLPVPRPNTFPATVPGPEAQRALEGADRAALPAGEGGRPMLPYGGQDFDLVPGEERRDRVPARLVDSPAMPQAPRATGLPIQPAAFQDIQDQATALPYQPGVTDLGEMPPSERYAPAAAGGDRVDALIAGVNSQRTQKDFSVPQTNLILDKSGKPFKDATINLAVANSIKRGKNVEAVQIGPNQWGMRPVVDEGPKTGGKKQRAAVEKELAAVQHLGYDAMRDKAEAMIDAGQDVDVVYDVLAGMEAKGRAKDDLIGLTWRTPHAERTVVGFNEKEGRYEVEDSRFRGAKQLLTRDGVEQERARDEANRTSREYAAKEAERQAEAEKKARDKADDLKGFDTGMSPMRRRAVIDVLSRQVGDNGKVSTRKYVIQKRVDEGYTVETVKGERRLISRDGAFLTQDQITKTGMDYAEHLIASRDKSESVAPVAEGMPAPEPKAPPKAEKPKPQPKEDFDPYIGRHIERASKELTTYVREGDETKAVPAKVEVKRVSGTQVRLVTERSDKRGIAYHEYTGKSRSRYKEDDFHWPEGAAREALRRAGHDVDAIMPKRFSEFSRAEVKKPSPASLGFSKANPGIYLAEDDAWTNGYLADTSAPPFKEKPGDFQIEKGRQVSVKSFLEKINRRDPELTPMSFVEGEDRWVAFKTEGGDLVYAKAKDYGYFLHKYGQDGMRLRQNDVRKPGLGTDPKEGPIGVFTERGLDPVGVFMPMKVSGSKDVQSDFGLPLRASELEEMMRKEQAVQEKPQAAEGGGQQEQASEEKLGLTLGEKIGGSRKDTAESTGERVRIPGKDGEGKTWWQKRFTAVRVTESNYTSGAREQSAFWGISDAKGKLRTGAFKFDTKEEAEAAIPLAAVSLKHRVTSKGDGTWEIYRKITDRKSVTIKDGFGSKEAAQRYMAQNAAEILAIKTGYGEEILAKPEKVMRGGVPRRDGPAKGQDFLDTFGFRGVEFGEWNDQLERQEVLNHAYDGLLDMAEILNVPPKALSLNGELALAFGARGRGLSSAKAHYELDYGVINLTKMTGAGSLAHEWFHAMDHYLARQDTKASSEKVQNERGDTVFKVGRRTDYEFQSHGPSYKSQMREELRDAFKALMHTMTHKAEKFKEDTEKAEKFVSRARGYLEKQIADVRAGLARQLEWGKKRAPATAEQLAKFDALADQLLSGDNLTLEMRDNDAGPKKRSRFGSYRNSNDVLDGMAAIYKEVRGRSGFNSEKTGAFNTVAAYVQDFARRSKMLEEARDETEKTKSVPTQFRQDSYLMDRGRTTNYWSEPHEMAARAFSAYLEDRTKGEGKRSDFLVYGANNKMLEYMLINARPFPEGTERAAINAAFDKFFQTVKTKETDKGVAMYSRVLHGSEEFRSQLESYINDRLKSNVILNLGNPGAILSRAGIPDSPIRLPQHVLRKARREHGLDLQVLAGLPEAVNDPIAVFRSKGIDKAWVVLTEIEYSGRSIVAAIHGSGDGAGAAVNDIKSVYGKDNEKLIRWIEQGLLLSWSKEKGPAWLRHSGGSDSPQVQAALASKKLYIHSSAEVNADFQLKREAPEDFRPARPLDRKTLDATVAAVQRSLSDAAPTVTYDNAAEASRYLGMEVPADARAFYLNGEVHIISDMIGSKRDLAEAIVHEQLRHHGFRAFLGKDYRAIMRQAWVNRDVRAKALELFREGYTDLKVFDKDGNIRRDADERDIIHAADEAIAHLADVGWKSGVMDRIVAAIRRALRRAGLGLDFSNAEIRDMISAAAQQVVAGKRKSLAGQVRGALAPAYQRVRHNPQTETPEFKKWFGDSKVVDKDGKPLVVYHGTPGEEFYVFDKSKGGTGPITGNPIAKYAFWFSPREDYTDTYSGKNGSKMAVYLSMRKPYWLEFFGKDVAEMSNSKGIMVEEKVRPFIEKIKARGYDGIVMGMGDTAVEYAVFSPTQIKSATGNSGAFDGENPDIRYSRSPAAQEARDRFGIALDPAGKKFDGRRVKNDIYAKFVHQQQPLIDAMDDKGEREAMERAISTSIRGSGSKVAEILERFGTIVNGIRDERDQMFYEAIRKFQREEALATSRPEYLAQDYRANVRSLNAMLRQATSPQDKALIRDAIKAHKEMYKRQVKGISLQHAQQQLADIRAEIGPSEFARLEQISREHRRFEQDAIIERLHNEGIMSDDAYQKITGAPEYQFYSALQREIDDRVTQALGAKEVVKRLKGSDKLSISSVDATIANLQRTEQLIGRNRVARMLTNDIRKLTPDLQAAIRQIPVNSEKYAPADAVVVFVGGKKQFWKVPEDIRIALEGVSEPEMNLVMKALSVPSKILRAGATLSFEFMARNPIRDQFTAFIFSKHGYIPFWDMAKGFASLIKKDAVFHEWRQDGGDNAFLVALDRDSKNQQARELLGLPKDWKGQVKHYVTSPLQLLQDISAFAERGTRLGAYKRARTTLDKQGVALDQAREMAAHESREITLDFGRMGYQGRAINQIVAFWNANLQDIDKLQRTMRERPGQTMLKMTLGLMLPSLLLWMANKDDEDYQQLPIWLRNLFWNFKVPGGKEFISLPKPFLPGAVFGTFLGEAVPELLTRGDKKFAAEALKNIGSNLMAVPFPTAAKPIVEWWANYSFFRNAPIENQSMQRLPDGMRVRTGTSDVIAALGRMTDISPLKLENTWRGVTGGLGRTATDVADYAMKKAVGSDVADPAKKWWEVTPVVKGFVRPEPIGSGGRALDDFFDNMEAARQAKGGYQALVKSGNKDEAKAFMAENKTKMLLASAYESASRDLSKLREAAAAVRRDKTMSAEAKREKLDAISRRMSKIAMRTNDLWNKRTGGMK